MNSKLETVQAVEEAHNALRSKFIDKHGIILDLIGEIPTPDGCATGRPNAIGCFCPIENGPMFNGLYLSAVCERARRSGNSTDKEQARQLAQGLIKCASVSDVPGMIVRGMATDGKSHLVFGQRESKSCRIRESFSEFIMKSINEE